MFCLSPPLEAAPLAFWYCPDCLPEQASGLPARPRTLVCGAAGWETHLFASVFLLLLPYVCTHASHTQHILTPTHLSEQDCETCGLAVPNTPVGRKRKGGASSSAAAQGLSYCSECGALCHEACMQVGVCKGAAAAVGRVGMHGGQPAAQGFLLGCILLPSSATVSHMGGAFLPHRPPERCGPAG